MNKLKDYYFAIDGVKVCSKGHVFGDTFERFPKPDSCRNELQTYSFDSTAFRDRMIGAVNYLRTNFCKPRAF